MDYVYLTADQAVELRKQRVAELEAEHFRVRLASAEHAITPPALAETLADIARRIAMHCEALGIVVSPPDGVEQAIVDGPDTPGAGDASASDTVAPDAVPHDH